LKRLRVKYPDAVFHLVGHSTGGLDAELLARTPRPSDAARDEKTEKIRRSIRSIVTLASPLAGTSLAESPLAQFTAIDSMSDLVRAPASLLLFRGPSALLGLLGSAIGLVSDAAASDIARNVLHRFAGANYFTSLAFMRGLITDLAEKCRRNYD
jgi:pimeloyl-ACP methyl ester carboxylesterase